MELKSASPSAVLVIGVTGGSGSGKTTFARMLQANMGDNFCGMISQDSYYRDISLFVRETGRVNYDHPDSIEFDLMVRHLKQLKAGQDISVPIYDFVSHQRSEECRPFACRPVIILDGILLLTQSEVRSLLDFAFYIDTQEDLRFRRRLERDVRERGRTPESVRDQFMSQVKPMHDLYVEPSRRFADRVISGEKSFGPAIDEIVFGFKNPRERLAFID